MAEIRTSHERGNASLAMNTILSGSETECTHVLVKAVHSMRDSELNSNDIDEND
jgi:hypothetical protein